MENAKLTRKLRKIMKIFVITPRIETFKYTFKTDGLHSRSDRSSQQQEPSIKTPLFIQRHSEDGASEIPICNFLNRTAKKIHHLCTRYVPYNNFFNNFSIGVESRDEKFESFNAPVLSLLG